MTTVFAVTWSRHDRKGTLGIFTTREKAEAALRADQDVLPGYAYDVEEWELDDVGGPKYIVAQVQSR